MLQLFSVKKRNYVYQVNVFIDGEKHIFQVYYIVLARDLILPFLPRPGRKYCQMIYPEISVDSFSIKINLDTQYLD